MYVPEPTLCTLSGYALQSTINDPSRFRKRTGPGSAGRIRLDSLKKEREKERKRAGDWDLQVRLGPPEMKPMIAVLEMEPDGNGSWAIHGIVQDGKGRGRPSPSNQPTDGSLLVVLDGKMARVVEGRNAAIHRKYHVMCLSVKLGSNSIRNYKQSKRKTKSSLFFSTPTTTTTTTTPLSPKKDIPRSLPARAIALLYPFNCL